MRRSRLDSDGHLPSASASLAAHGAANYTRMQTDHLCCPAGHASWQDPDRLQATAARQWQWQCLNLL